MASSAQDIKPSVPQPLASTSSAAAASSSGDANGGDIKTGAGTTPTPAPANGKPAANGKDDDEEEVLGPDGLPLDASETLYIHNLNEKVRMEALQTSLLNLFKPYRPLRPVVSHRNMRMRGQAFVSFQDKESANRARKEVRGFPLYGRPMVLEFAKTKSDVVIKRQAAELGKEDEVYAEHLAARKERKKIARKTNPLRVKMVAKYKAAAADAAATGVPVPQTTRRQIQMPDEYLPPNKVLFLQNLPEGTTKDDLQEVFEQHPGLLEVRLIPTKKDIAFVEYADEASSTAAKDALHNFKIDGETKMKVTFARR